MIQGKALTIYPLALLLFLILTGCDSGAIRTEANNASNSAEQAAAAGMSHGEYVARLANCVACHSTLDGEPFAGGLPMAVPMLGNIYTTNITPDPETGIGSYSYDDFDRAMRSGRTPDGKRMYPAMPYPSYAKMSEQDMRALYDFFMNEVNPVQQANLPPEIPGWRNVRWAMGIWNLLAHENQPFTPDPQQSEAWNRGAYLVEGPGHCGACHTPRGLLLQERAMSAGHEAFLAGAELDYWYASSLNGDINSGLGRWQEADIAEFMQTGRNRFSTAFGTMVAVINNSTRYMSDTDLQAMAVYLKSLPPANERNATAWQYDPAETEKLLAFDFSTPGAQLYFEYCASCHVSDGSGYYPWLPPLAGNPVSMDPEPSSLINLTLNGSLRLVTSEGPAVTSMPYFRDLLSDTEIAEVLTYIRSAWGHAASPVSAAQVSEIRAATSPSANNDIQILRMQ